MDTILSFYKFTPIKNTKNLQNLIKQETSKLKIKGTILAAPEGINGMISGDCNNIKNSIVFMRPTRAWEIILRKATTSKHLLDEC